jgi:Dolichyl-phosphate-mannose-protein mannosyltransferase
MRPRECAAAWFLGLLLLPTSLLILTGPALFGRPFWSDEILSWLIASDPDFGHGLAALAGGVDTNAPLLHLLYRGVGTVLGHTPGVYRATSALLMSLTLVGLYLTLRKTFAPRSAIAGCAAFCTLPIVIHHATEARFYALQLLGIVWAAHGLISRTQRPNVANAVQVAIASMIACGAHYFGVIAVACMVGAAFISRTSTLLNTLKTTYPTLAGVAVTACCLPLLASQRAAMADVGGTWVPDFFWLNLRTVAAMVLPTAWACGAALIVLAAILKSGKRGVADSVRRHVSPLTALFVYGLVLLVFDRIVQPVLVPRYFVAMTPALAWLVAVLVDRASTTLATVATAACLALGGSELLRLRHAIEHPAPHSALAILLSVRDMQDETIVSDWLGHALPIWVNRPELRDRLFYLPDTRLHDPFMAQAIPYERQMARCVQQFYGMPGGTTLGQVRQMSRLVLVSEFPESVETRFAGWAKQSLGETTFLLKRRGVESVDVAD